MSADVAGEITSEPGAEAAPPDQAARPAFPPRARVLIVDDIAENRTLLGMFCDQFGIAHDGVDGGRAAVEAARSGRYDVILMDIFMPGMDGMSATRAIRDLPGRVSSAPIIAVTTAAELGDVARYRACGMSDVVPKPIVVSRLMQALVSAFEQTRRRSKSGHRKPAGAARLSA